MGTFTEKRTGMERRNIEARTRFPLQLTDGSWLMVDRRNLPDRRLAAFQVEFMELSSRSSQN